MSPLSDLRDRTSKDYNRAAVFGPEFNPKHPDLEMIAQNALPVLKAAQGPLGILRNLDVSGRMPGILESLYMNGTEHHVVHVIFLPDKTILIKYWTVIVTKD